MLKSLSVILVLISLNAQAEIPEWSCYFQSENAGEIELGKLADSSNKIQPTVLSNDELEAVFNTVDGDYNCNEGVSFHSYSFNGLQTRPAPSLPQPQVSVTFTCRVDSGPRTLRTYDLRCEDYATE